MPLQKGATIPLASVGSRPGELIARFSAQKRTSKLSRSSHRMVAGNLFVAQPQESRGVVVEDVALLRLASGRRIFDRLDRGLDDARPDHLVGAEHDPVAIAGFDELLRKAIEGRRGSV